MSAGLLNLESGEMSATSCSSESEHRVDAPKVLVESRDLLDLILGEVKVDVLEVLLGALRVVGLGDDGDSPLSRPAEENLSGRLGVGVGDGLDGGVLEEGGGVESTGVLDLEEGLRSEGGVCRRMDRSARAIVRKPSVRRTGSDGESDLLGELDERLLSQVGVVLEMEKFVSLREASERRETELTSI